MAKELGGIRLLGEHELELIADKVSPADRKSFSEVCKLWYKVESRNRSSLRLLSPVFPRQVFPRFPNLLTFQSAYPITDHDVEFLGQTCPKLEVIDLSRGYSGPISSDLFGLGLFNLASCCPKLSKVILYKRKGIFNSIVVSLISLAPSLKHLDLGHCCLVSDEALQVIGSSSSISYLDLQWCLKITDVGLGFLATGSISRTLKTLILDWNSNLTDNGVSQLQKMHCLELLSLNRCSRFNITDIGGVAISGIRTLKQLSLRWLGKVSDSTIVALAKNCPNLEILDLSFCERITGAGVRALFGHARLQTVVLCWIKVEASDLDHLVLTCESLKSIVLSHGELEQISPQMQEQSRRFVGVSN